MVLKYKNIKLLSDNYNTNYKVGSKKYRSMSFFIIYSNTYYLISINNTTLTYILHIHHIFMQKIRQRIA